MSTEIPTTTQMKRLPMIVDIAIGTNGEQMYQVHETSKFVRKEMPKSTKFSDSSMGSFDSLDQHNSPPEKLLGGLPSMNPRKRSSASATSSPDLVNRIDDNEYDDQDGNSDSSHLSAGSSSSDNVWSKDVQNAFEEVLAIVPKNGLNKIKIGGRSCGRNELISDYILAKTGKFRSRKQVSSHIQVIKNMGLKKDLIRLINDGPTFLSPLEIDENSKRFEEIFTKINLNKSLGVNSMLPSGRTSTGAVRRHSSATLASAPKRKKSPDLFVGVRNICFSIENLIMGSSPIYLSLQDEAPAASLSVKENAAISNRFPGLEEFADSNVPIIHNMVRIHSPLQLPSNFNIETGLKTSYMLDFGSSTGSVSSFTTVYSFGNEVLKVNEEDFQVNTYQPFLLKFWKCFFLQLLHQPASLDAAFKGITVKQIIYDSLPGQGHIVPKNKIRAVLLWEFAKVDDLKSAKSSTSRLFLPQSISRMSLSAPINYYPEQHVQMAPPIAVVDPLESDPLYHRDGLPFSFHEPEENFSQGYYPVHTTQPQGMYQHQYGYHPSANVNLGSIRVKEESDFITPFY